MPVPRRLISLLCSVAAAGHLVVRTEGDQREYASSLDSPRQRPLVLRANARLAPRLHLVAVRDKASQPAHILVVDMLHLVHAESADLAPCVVTRPAPPALESTLSAATATASEWRSASAAARSWRAAWRTGCRRSCWCWSCGLFCGHSVTYPLGVFYVSVSRLSVSNQVVGLLASSVVALSAYETLYQKCYDNRNCPTHDCIKQPVDARIHSDLSLAHSVFKPLYCPPYSAEFIISVNLCFT